LSTPLRAAPARACTALWVVALFAASGMPDLAVAAPLDTAGAPRQVVMYLARRSWHIDVGFAVADLSPSLAIIARRFPRAKYLFFGFGDRHYLLSKGKGTATLAGALFPGPGLILVTSIENSPAQAFGDSHVLEFVLSAPQAGDAQRFVQRSLAAAASGDGREDTDPGEVVRDFSSVAEGPYEGSVYYEAVARYSALHTCNTWAAEALQSAGLDVRPRLAVFAGQTWARARKAQQRAQAHSDAPEGVLAPRALNLNRREAGRRSGRPLWSSSPAAPRQWSSVGEAGSSC
jgi:hypothetical protein